MTRRTTDKLITFKPAKGKDVGHGYSVQTEAAQLKRDGSVLIEFQLWNGTVRKHRRFDPTDEAAATAFLDAIVRAAPDLDAATVERAITEVGLVIQQDVREQGTPADGTVDDAAPPTRPSLSPPGFVCVALNADGERVYVLLGEDGTLHAVASAIGPHREGSATHVPPADLLWLLPRADAILHHWQEASDPAWGARLLADLEGWHRAASDLGRDEAYLLLALYDVLTYVPEQTDYLPIVLLEAEPERGKSRTGQAWACVARHGEWLQGIREANLLRAASDRNAALFIDLMKVWETAEKKDCTDILLGRWERGGTVERVLYPDRGPFADTVRYNVFGPTLIATNEPIHRILDTRCLRIDMPLTTRRFSGRVRPEDALPLVERLMAWRGRMLATTLAECEPPADGRLGDILRPMRRTLRTISPTRDNEFDAIVAWQTRRRNDDLASSTEAAIVKAIGASDGHRFKDQLGDTWVSVSTVLDAFNATRGDQAVKANWLGRKVRGMGWTVARIGHDNTTALKWDDHLLAQLRVRYGLADADKDTPDPPSKSASHTSHTSQSAHNSRQLPSVERDARDAQRDEEGGEHTSHTSQDQGPSHGQNEPSATDATHATHNLEGTANCNHLAPCRGGCGKMTPYGWECVQCRSGEQERAS